MEKNCWMDVHIAHGLELMGHAISRFYFGEYLCEFYEHKRRPEQIKKNIELVNAAKTLRDTVGLDLIFCFVYDDFLMPKYAKILSNLNVCMVNYNVDMPSQWYRQIRTACYFDLILCGQPDNIECMRQYSKKVLYFPMAANSLQRDAFAASEKIHDVSFIGTAFPYRQHVLSELSKSSIRLSIYGKYWDGSHPNVYYRSMQKTLSDIQYYAWPRLRAEGLSSLFKVMFNRLLSDDKNKFDFYIPPEIIRGKTSDRDLPILFYRSKINIGLTRYALNDPYCIGRCQMKLRDFEVPMAGGFYLVEKAPGYDREFLDGKEVVTWQTLPDLSEKIHYYLKHDDEREAIALAGQKRAMRDHTWTVRFNTLFSELALLR